MKIYEYVIQKKSTKRYFFAPLLCQPLRTLIAFGLLATPARPSSACSGPDPAMDDRRAPDPPPPLEVSAFRAMIAVAPKRPPSMYQQKFVKKMASIPSVALPEEDTCKAALNLDERGLIGQFTGLWPSPKSVEDWTQRNWKPLIKEGVKSYFVGKGFFVFVFENPEDKGLIFRNEPYFMGP